MSEAKNEASELNDLLCALRSGKQADIDGITVVVSRRACEEAADLIEKYKEALYAVMSAQAPTPVQTYQLMEDIAKKALDA